MATQQLASPTTPIAGISPSLVAWVRVAVKWKKLVFRTAIGVFALAVVVALLMPSRFTATTVLLPPQQTQSAGAAMMAQLSSMGGMAAAAGSLGIKNPNDQQVALIKSRVVEDAMVARFHLQDLYRRKYLSTTRKRWEKLTSVESGLKDGLIRLTVTDRDPRRAADMANAWVEEYRLFTATIAITEASQRRLFYERQVSEARDDLAHAEEAMKQTQIRTGVIDVEGQDRSMIASAAILRGQLAAKQIEIRGMRQFASEGNPDLQRAQQEASAIEGQLATLDAASDRKSGDLIAPRGTASGAALDYARALRELKYRETIQDLLTRQYESARVDEARQGALVQVVEPAVAPDRSDSGYRVWILVLALLFCLPLGLLTAFATEVFTILRAMYRRSGSLSAMLDEVMASC